MASTTASNFGNFYNDSPAIIILDKRGYFYNFPANYWNNGNGGDRAGEGDSKNFFNGRKFNNFRGGGPWPSTWMVDTSNYTSKGSMVSDQEKDNAWDENTFRELADLANRTVLPGYERVSSGYYNNSSSNYIIADRGVGYYNWAFAVFKKKEPLAFFNDFIAIDKAKFLLIASDNAGYGNQRQDPIPKEVCSKYYNDLTQEGKNRCNDGLTQWCKEDTTRIWGTASNALPSTGNCYNPVQNSKLDDQVVSGCSSNLDILSNPFCKDQRLNSGSIGIKNRLGAKLAEFCGNNTNINDAKCVDVYNACSSGNNPFDDTTQPNYKCNSLIKNLNDQNKIKMLQNTNLKLSTLSKDDKTSLRSSFNTTGSKLVEEALCNIAANSTDPACQDFLNSNFGGLISSSDTNPILVMYFTGDNFATPAGFANTNTLVLPSIDRAKGINNIVPTTTLGVPWCAKFYVYVTPSSKDDYLFRLNADDDAKLFINNTLIIDAWGKTCCTDYDSPARISLDPANGPYLFYIEFRDIGGAANISLTYSTSKSNFTSKDFLILPANNPNFGTSPLAGLTASTLYMSKFSPYLTSRSAREIQSIAYCTKDQRFAYDANCIGTASNSYNGINFNYKDNTNFNKTMIDFCTDPTTNLFATETGNTFCKNPNTQSYLMNAKDPNTKLTTAITNYCKEPANNIYPSGATTTYCKTTDNLNTTQYPNTAMNTSYANALRDSRKASVISAINSSISSTDITKRGKPTQDVIDYITTDYPAIQTKIPTNNKNSDLIIPAVFPYCENISNISDNTLCNAIYTTYKTDPNIIASQQRIDDFKNGIQSKAFMGKSNNPNATIAATQNAKYIAERDAPQTFSRYLPHAINYCAAGDNIVSPECQTYYDNVQNNINQMLRSQYPVTATTATITATATATATAPAVVPPIARTTIARPMIREPDRFGNKDEFCGDNSYDNIYSTSTTSSDTLYKFLLFLLFVILITVLNKWVRCKKENKPNKNISLLKEAKDSSN